MDKKAENNDVSKDSGESKDRSPLAQKLLDDDDNIVYLKMHSSLLSRPEIQKLLSESQQNANEQSGSNTNKQFQTSSSHLYQIYQHNINIPPLCNL